MSRIITVLALVALAFTAFAKDVTTRRRLKVDRQKIEKPQPSVADTLRGHEIEDISFAGFDKPLRSSYETVFVTNRSEHDMIGVVFECEYTDMSGRQLHKRIVSQRCDIPSGQTRQLRFKSWDLQSSFHYELSPKPRRADGTPFKVTCTCVALIIPKSNQ